MLIGVATRLDPEQRRNEIAAAVWRVVAERGFEGVSLRNVSAEAGISMGLIQYHFATKQQMLRCAMDAVQQSAEQRFMAEVAQLPDPPPPRAVVRAFLVQLIPVGEQRRREATALMSYMVGGARDDDIGERMRIGSSRLTDFVAGQVEAAGVAHEPRAAAATVLALADGLAAHVLAGYIDPEQALQLLDAHLAHLFVEGPSDAGLGRSPATT